MTGTRELSRQGPMQMSLRLWSDRIALAPLIANLGLDSDVAHVAGQPVASTARIARRHFASLEKASGRDAADICGWLKPLLAKIGDDRQVASLIRSAQVEAIFWIAVLGRRVLPTPHLDRRLIERAAEIGASIFIENYTQLVDGNPSKLWLPVEPAMKAVPA